MRILIVKDEKNLTGLRTRLLRSDVSPAAAKLAEAELRAANPHVDVKHLQPGTALVVPDAAEFKVRGTESMLASYVDTLSERLEIGLRQLAERLEAGSKLAARQREEVAGVLSSRGFRAVAGSDESVRADAQRVQEALAADAERSKDRRKRLELALKRAQADLHALRQRLD